MVGKVPFFRQRKFTLLGKMNLVCRVPSGPSRKISAAPKVVEFRQQSARDAAAVKALAERYLPQSAAAALVRDLARQIYANFLLLHVIYVNALTCSRIFYIRGDFTCHRNLEVGSRLH